MNRQCIVPPLDGLFISGFRPNGLAGSGVSPSWLFVLGLLMPRSGW